MLRSSAKYCPNLRAIRFERKNNIYDPFDPVTFSFSEEVHASIHNRMEILSLFPEVINTL